LAIVTLLPLVLAAGGPKPTEAPAPTEAPEVKFKVGMVSDVGGRTGNGGIAAAKERGKWGVGVDVDQYYTLPNEKDILVTSTMKRLDRAVFSVIKSAVEGKFEGGTNYIATLENEGVGVGPFHDFEDKVPEDIKASPEQVQEDIIAKKLKTGRPSRGV
jgi:basic membrane protein A